MAPFYLFLTRSDGGVCLFRLYAAETPNVSEEKLVGYSRLHIFQQTMSANACSKTHSQLESAEELKSSHVQGKFDDFAIKTVL